jgi:hypothetical protein
MELLQDPAHNFNMVPQQTNLSIPSNLHSTSSSNTWQLPQILQQQQQQQQLQLRQAPPSLTAQLQLQQQIFSQNLQLQQQQQQLAHIQLEEQYNSQTSLLGHGLMSSRNGVNTRALTAATAYNINLGGGPPSTSTGGSYNPGRDAKMCFITISALFLFTMLDLFSHITYFLNESGFAPKN